MKENFDTRSMSPFRKKAGVCLKIIKEEFNHSFGKDNLIYRRIKNLITKSIRFESLET
jgi:hypothetical protein